MKVKKVSKPTLEGDTYLVARAVNHNAEVLEGALNRLEKLEEWVSEDEPIDFDKFSKSEDMAREEAIDMVRKAFAGWEDEFDRGDDWSKEHKARDMAIKALEQEPFKNAYIQVVKERDIAIGQLDELGYSLGEKIEPRNKVITEIEAQEKWLAEAGYNAYNVGVAFNAIKRALGK